MKPRRWACPEVVLGIELSAYAAELARVSVWIGEIQWMRRNGFEAAKNPILRSLKTIENRDAVLNPDGTRAEWPKADVVVGNPPFLGNKRMISELGEDYATGLRKAWKEVPGGVDLVIYWFAKAWDMIKSRRLSRAGLVATNSIRGGANREVLLDIVSEGRIFEAWSDQEWTVEGAAVRVSLVAFDISSGTARLDGQSVAEIFSDLSATTITSARKLKENSGASTQGAVLVGPFDIPGEIARKMLLAPVNPHGQLNSAVVRPLRNGRDLTTRHRDCWVVDFSNMSEADASLFEMPFEYVREVVRPIRIKNRRARRAEVWWQHGETGIGWRKRTTDKERYIATSQVAKHRMFVWLHSRVQPHQTVIAFSRDDDTTFGVLHSTFHELWALRMGTSLEDRPRYTPSTTFETFPFPEGLTPNIPAADYADDPRAIKIAAAAKRLNELRENWLNPADLVDRVPEVVPGYPDRILPKDDAAAKELKKRTLTNLYNARPAWLDHAHKALDEAVAGAYGWGDDWRAGVLTEDEILARLFRLNQQRAKTD